METVIECTNVKRTFVSRTLLGKKQETHALNGLDFSVPQGIVFGLLGPNGSGKTTTIRILSTLLTPTSGQAKVLGFDVVRESGKVRGRIGLILGGERGLYGRLTGVENLKYFAALNHLSREVSRKRVEEIIDLVGLAEAGNRPVEQYSRGMRQRLHIARGLLTDPEVLFMDEPTIGLDPAGAQELRQLIPAMVQRGKTILLTTHYMSEADELSSQVAIINRGQIIAMGTPSVIKRSFSKIAVCEVICRQSLVDAAEAVRAVSGIQRVISSSDGPFLRLTIHVHPGTEIKAGVVEILGEDNVESIVMRDPTLEEAYLSIIK
ncbi:MAG TPA: ATP-binding cassette domain-containing protein [Dehalococcoidales bacterium]|nr:ATP-binding cassette domain-containing protein [Dehalococcoidales bacterium]